MPAIEVSHLTKEYRLGALKSVKQTLLNAGARLVGREVLAPPPFKALDDVSFSIEPGEVVGIIGHNGAGKSTLLKMLARISTPTSGNVKVNGRIAPLIEVGAGFVPDFTGRENVYLNGSILGLSKKEIDRKFDEIVDFAEMAEFIDTPVKRYSSGMQVKLAFAVATSVDSEILIVDEVLAVGDLAFQRKCFDRMEKVIRSEDRTVLLVSHNIRQVERLCKRVIMLNRGSVAADSDSSTVCNRFIDFSNEQIRTSTKQTISSPAARTSDDIDFIGIELLDQEGHLVASAAVLSSLRVLIRFQVNVKTTRLAFLIGIHSTDFVYLTANNTVELPRDYEPGTYSIEMRLESLHLLPGVYSFRVWIGTPEGRVSFCAENIGTLKISSNDILINRQQGMGLILLDDSWHETGPDGKTIRIR